jgi:hypothetical protein
MSFLQPRLPPRGTVDDAELVTGRCPAPGRLELGRLLGHDGLDGQGAPGELGHQVGGHALDFAFGHPPGDGPGLRPRHPETLRHEVLDQAHVALGQGHHEGVQGSAVQSAPHPVGDGLGTVPNDGVMMELGIAVAALEVQPRTGDDTSDRFLAGALGAGAGEKDVVLGPGDDLTEGLRHNLFDGRPGGLVPHGPHKRDGFRRVECEVVAGHRCALTDRGEPAHGLAGDGVGQLGQHPVQHLGRHHIAWLHRPRARPEPVQPSAQEPARRCPLGRVVAGCVRPQLGRAGHAVGQVLPGVAAHLERPAHRQHRSGHHRKRQRPASRASCLPGRRWRLFCGRGEVPGWGWRSRLRWSALASGAPACRGSVTSARRPSQGFWVWVLGREVGEGGQFGSSFFVPLVKVVGEGAFAGPVRCCLRFESERWRGLGKNTCSVPECERRAGTGCGG